MLHLLTLNSQLKLKPKKKMKEKKTPKYFVNERESLLKLFFKIIVQSYKF